MVANLLALFCNQFIAAILLDNCISFSQSMGPFDETEFECFVIFTFTSV
jgi:hypothetical protein